MDNYVFGFLLFLFICSISFIILWAVEINYSWFLFRCLSAEQKIISRVLVGKLNSHSLLIFKTAPHKSSLTDLSTFTPDQSITSMCLNLKSFPRYSVTQLLTGASHFPGSVWLPWLEAQEKEPEGHRQNMNLLPQLELGNLCCWKLRISVHHPYNRFLQPCLGRRSEGLLLHLHLVPGTVGLWVQLDPLDASTTQVHAIASSSLLDVFRWVTASAICTSLHLCSTCPQKCFDLLFVRPLDKQIIHQHNHPIIIQLQRSLCQLVLCVNDPFQKNRFPVFLWVPSLPA